MRAKEFALIPELPSRVGKPTPVDLTVANHPFSSTNLSRHDLFDEPGLARCHPALDVHQALSL
jgi:hypothetical protein